MNKLIEFPEIFKGRWDHLLILSYGVDLPYFENVILRQEFQCRNKIILADGVRFLQSCERYNVDGRLRFLNQRYIAEGIYVNNSAHAKLVLLTTRENGKLLIGSGNLGSQGYTSGGELFTLYEYSAKDDSHLVAFKAVWEFVEKLVRSQAVKGVAVQALDTLYAGTPWLMRAIKRQNNPVLHNIDRSFIEQLQEIVDGESVQELWVMSPFHDPKARALEQLIETFKPRVTNVVVQPKNISANPSSLRRISKKLKKRIAFYPFENLSNGESAYVHAKLYLLKTASRAICLQGSPNCSQVALLNPSSSGNVEIANLLIGKRNAFDELFDNLNLLPATDLSRLKISYKEIEAPQQLDESEWLLTGAAWRADIMTLYFRGGHMESSRSKLNIGGTSFKITVIHTGEDEVQIRIPPEAQALLSERAVPIVLETNGKYSFPIFPCHLEMLDREANTVHSAITSQELQNFDPEDPEFVNLLRELEASFPIDRQSIWQLAGKSTPNLTTDEDDQEYHLDYADIDYELLQQHPKIQQYLHGRGKGLGNSSQSRLQQLLNAINAHFSGLVDVAYRRGSTRVSPLLDDASTAESFEDEVVPSENGVNKSTVNRNKIKNALKRFVRRYLRGLRSPDFLRVVGAEVVVNNYVIFSHILWRLLKKDEWIDTDFILESFVIMLSFFWGNEKKIGFFTQLDKSQKAWALEIIRKQKSDALLVAAVHYANWQAMLMGKIGFRLTLRDFWRYFLLSKSFEIDKEIILDAWVYLHDVFVLNVPAPTRITTELRELARLTNTSDALDALEIRLGLSKNSFLIKKAGFFRELHKRTEQIEYLESGAHINNFEDAKEVLRAWVGVGRRSYHSVKFPGGLIYFDSEVNKGLYYNRNMQEEIPFEDLTTKNESEWEEALTNMSRMAKVAEKDITLNLVGAQAII